MRSKPRGQSLFPNWDAANQRRANRTNAKFRERSKLFCEVATPEGAFLVWAIPIGEPINSLDEFGILLLPFVMLWKRFVGRGDYKVVVLRQGRFGGLRKIYRSGRVTKEQAKVLVADLVALARACE